MEISNKQIGMNIKNARKRAHMTQEVLSENLNITTTHMSNVERGAKSMGLSTLAYTAEILHTTLDELVFGVAGKEGILQNKELRGNIDYYLDHMSDVQLEYTLKQIELFINSIRQYDEKDKKAFVSYDK